jgi:hypothetical protein
MTREPKKRKPMPIHIHGNAAHNMGILIAIGNLIVHWSSNESVFLAMLQTLVTGDSLTAAIIWQSQKTSRPRLDLVSRLVREQVKDTKLIEDIEAAITSFSGLSRARNFYCHATYHRDLNDGAILGAHGMALSPEGDPLTFEEKPFNSATINEINDVSGKLVGLQTSLGVQRVKLPELPDEDQPPQVDHPPKNAGT